MQHRSGRLLQGHFESYQLRSAQTWEHQALTRARVIMGDLELGQQVEAIIRRALTQARDPEAQPVRSRARIFREHGDQDPDLKHARGGLVEADLARFFRCGCA